MPEKPYHCRNNCPIVQGDFRKNCKGATRTALHLSELVLNSTNVILKDGTRVVASVNAGEVVTPISVSSTEGELGEYACRNTGIAQAVELAASDITTIYEISDSDE